MHDGDTCRREVIDGFCRHEHGTSADAVHIADERADGFAPDGIRVAVHGRFDGLSALGALHRFPFKPGSRRPYTRLW